MTDVDRVRLAVQSGTRMLGPIERQRCGVHPRRWETYRWTWPVGSEPEFGTVRMIRGCVDCLKHEMDEL